MAKAFCPVCKQIKENVGPKIVGRTKILEPKLTQPVDVLKTLIMCNDCWEESRK